MRRASPLACFPWFRRSTPRRNPGRGHRVAAGNRVIDRDAPMRRWPGFRCAGGGRAGAVWAWRVRAGSVLIRSVAQSVGVTPPSIYLHVDDKNALLDAVCARYFGSSTGKCSGWPRSSRPRLGCCEPKVGICALRRAEPGVVPPSHHGWSGGRKVMSMSPPGRRVAFSHCEQTTLLATTRTIVELPDSPPKRQSMGTG